MPVGFNSPARNFFLLGSSGDGVVGNFFKTIDQSAGTDGVYLPDEIRYNYVDQKYLLAGSASDSNSKGFGWFEKRDETGTADFVNRVESTQVGVTTTLRAMELDVNNNLIVAGFSGTTPWIAKYSNSGVLDWQSTTNSANVRYLGLTSDSNGNYYACGRTSYLLPDTQAFVEKFDSNGNPGWGKSAFMLGRDVVLKSIAANSRGEVVAVGFLEDDSADKGYIVKIDTNTGEVLWDRTLSPDAGGDQIKCTDVYIDNQDQIYVSVNGTDDGYLVKYTPEGNIQWQRKTAQSSGSITYDQVFSDGETQQTVVFGTYTDSGDTSGLLTKYSRNGDLVWRRTLTSSFNNSDTFASVCLDGDPSFYYFMYIDGIVDGLNGTPDTYTFGKVSSSGNGLGAFQYTEGTGETIDYVILAEPDKIGRLSDGSVRHDTSDLVAYPFGATKIMFDDLAAKVTNKKRQMDGPDSFEYSGSPAIRIFDFQQELNLLGDVYSGSGDWLDQSGKGNNATTTFTTTAGEEPFSGAGSTEFDGTGDHLLVDTSSVFNYGTNDFTIEFWWYRTSNDRQALFHGSWGQDWSIGIDFNGASNNQKLGMWASSSGSSWDMLIADGGGNGITTGTPALNQWSHIAYVRNGSDFQLYLNGTSVGQVTNSSAINSKTTTRQQAIGAWWNSEIAMSDVHGYLSNFRIVIGSAIYTSNFTPPTAPLTAVAGTQLLTCQGSTITDASANNLGITAFGNAAAVGSTTNTVAHNAAGYFEFDGTDDYITLDEYSNLANITGNISIEAWFNIDTTNSGNRCIWSKGRTPDPGGGIQTHSMIYVSSNNTLVGLIGNLDGTPSSVGAGGVTAGQWYHVVLTSDGVNNSIYLNGVLKDTDTRTSTEIYNTNQNGGVSIGRDVRYPTTSDRMWDGEIGEVRVYPRALTAAAVFQNYNATKSKYINEAPDTAPKIGPGIVYDSNLLLNYDFGNRATFDNAQNDIRDSTKFTAFNTVNTVKTLNAAKAPDGTMTALKLERGNTGSSTWYTDYVSSISANNAGTYTYSVWLRGPDGFTGGARIALLEQTGGNTEISVNITDQWQQYSVTKTYDGTFSTNIRIHPVIFRNQPGAIDAGKVVPEFIYMWQPQLEKASTTGRHVPTYGTSITAPTTVKNLSTGSADGTITGAEFDTDGYFVFDGTDDHIDIDPVVSLSTTSGFTVCAWLKMTGLQSSTTWNYFIQDADGVNPVFESGIYNNNNYSFAWKDNSVGVQVSTVLTQNQWHLICFGVNSSAGLPFIYRDGIYAGGSSTAFNSGNFPIAHIMGRSNTSNNLGGHCGEVQAYNRELSGAEVLAHFNATRGKYGV